MLCHSDNTAVVSQVYSFRSPPQLRPRKQTNFAMGPKSSWGQQVLIFAQLGLCWIIWPDVGGVQAPCLDCKMAALSNRLHLFIMYKQLSQRPVWWEQISMGTVSGLAQPLQQVRQVSQNPPLRFWGGGRAWHINNISAPQLKIWHKFLLASADSIFFCFLCVCVLACGCICSWSRQKDTSDCML